jgi:tetratricopeptide (TPR) repeat protein
VAMASYARLLGGEHPQTAHAISVYAYLLLLRGEDEQAEAYFRKALGTLRAYPDHPNTAYARKGLGQLLVDHGRAAEAEPLLREAVVVYTATLGAEHIRTADAQMWLGLCLTARAQYEQAEAALLPSLAIIEAGGEASMTQRAVQALADLYEAWGRPDQAAPYRARLTDGS